MSFSRPKIAGAVGVLAVVCGAGIIAVGQTDPLPAANGIPVPETASPVTTHTAPPVTVPPPIPSVPEPEASVGDQLAEGTVFVAKSLLEEGLVGVWSEPRTGSELAWELPVPTEFFGPRYFAVIGESGDFFEVTVPVRPNGSTGWIPKADVVISVVESSITIDLSEHKLTAYVNGVEAFSMSVAIGRPDHPTPVGDWFLRDELPWDEDSVYGPYVLALNAYSDTIMEINGGDAVVALHGTSRPDLIGQDVSLGCVRIENSDITALAQIVEPGTPVHIVE